MSLGRWGTVFLICVFLMYVGNIIGIVLLSLLRPGADIGSENPLLPYVMTDALLPQILFITILGPLFEELVFRKLFIDRLRPYGEKLAVLTSALAFGLFHGNLSQFFYAAMLGCVFGYVYLKTGRLRYSVALHSAINALGSIIAPRIARTAAGAGEDGAAEILSSGGAVFAGYLVLMVLLSLAGLTVLCLRYRHVTFDPASEELPRGKRLTTAWINPGMLMFTVVCAALMIFTLSA